MKVRIKRLHPWAKIPKYETEGAAGFDLRSLKDIHIFPGDWDLIPIGLSFEIPAGYEMQIRQRSGISKLFPNYIMNAPGTVDSDYRGEVCVLVKNNSNDKVFHYRRGCAIAQGVIAPVITADFDVTEELTDTERGSGGFGSTGE